MYILNFFTDMDLSLIPDIEASLVGGFLTLYLVEWIVLKTREKYDIIMWLYIATIVIYIPFLIWGTNADMFKGFGVLIGLTLALFLNDKMIERTFHRTVEQRFIFGVTTVIVMIVLLFVFDILFTVLSTEGTWFRDVLDFIRYFGVVLFSLHQYPKYYFMMLHRSG